MSTKNKSGTWQWNGELLAVSGGHGEDSRCGGGVLVVFCGVGNDFDGSD